MRTRLLIGAVASSLALASPASAGIWTPVGSGTTADITAIHYRGGDNFWFGTGSGQIYKRSGGTFTLVSSNPGTIIRDIEFQPGGSIGLAVGTNGKVLRTTNGTTWTPVTLPSLSSAANANACSGAPEAAGDLDSVRFAGNGRAFIFGKGSQIARSPSGAANSATVGSAWVDGNKNGASCFVSKDVDDAFFVDDESGYLVSGDFGAVLFTSNHLTSTAATKAANAGNGYTTRRRVAGDANNPNRMWSVAPSGTGGSYYQATQDGWSTNSEWKVVNDGVMPADAKFYDIAASGGTVLTAGDAGAIQHSIDGANFYVDHADGTLATANWRAVDLASAADAAIGGTNGTLAVTSAANTIPDIVAPTGTIAGPSTATAGVPVTFSAAVADEAGGSGIDPGGYAWTAEGTAGGTGPSVALTFPSAGYYTVRLSFRDNAGNTATAATSVIVSAAPSGGGTQDTRPAPKLALTGKGNGATAKRSGGKVKVTIKGKVKLPAGVSAKTACKGTVQLTIKKGKTLVSARNAKLGKTCAFTKTVSLNARAVGSAKKLGITIRFQGNALIRPTTQSISVAIKR